VNDEAGGVDAVRHGGPPAPSRRPPSGPNAWRRGWSSTSPGAEGRAGYVTRGAVSPAELHERPERRRRVPFRPPPLGLLVGESGDLVKAFYFAYVPIEYPIVC
jgi:hypothetical protein